MKFIYALGFVVSTYILYKMKKRERENNLLLVHSNSKLAKFFKFITEHFLEVYAEGLLYSGHAQTVLLEFIDFRYSRRELFKLSDGGTVAVDHTYCKNDKYGRSKNKILIVIPGFTSKSSDYYIKNFLNEFVEEFDCRVVNVRGFGVKLTSPHMISTNSYKDVKEYLEFVCNHNKDKNVFAVGFSYGGMLLVRGLGTAGELTPSNLIGGCGICYPMCLESTKNHVELQIGGLYSKYGALNLKKCFFENLEVIFDPNFYTKDHLILMQKDMIIEQVKNLTHVGEFDEIYTHKILNFSSKEEYYNQSKLGIYLKNIKIPFLSIFTKDDPIIPYEAIPLKLFQQNSNLITIISKNGGHMGFFKGLLPQRWIDIPIKTFIKTVEIIHNVEVEDISLSCNNSIQSSDILFNLEINKIEKILI